MHLELFYCKIICYRLIAYASSAQSKAQQNYPQIEMEATAIKYGCMKFHEYVYGKKLTVETDHKPLEIIFKKPLHLAPATPTNLQPINLQRLQHLSTYNGLIFKGEKMIVPKSKQNYALKQIHSGHFGIQRCIRRARDALFWNGMTKDITDLVNKCSVCQSNQRKPTKEPIISHPIPKFPWEIIGTDLVKFGPDEYILICDSYSGFFDFEVLKSQSSKATIQQLKKWFSVHGKPKILKSNNGPQYNSSKFRQFETTWGFTHQTSSPRYPKSNGLAERYVQTAKNLLRKCKADHLDVQLALLNYRNTPRSDTIRSPNEGLMSRITRSTVPTADSIVNFDRR